MTMTAGDLAKVYGMAEADVTKVLASGDSADEVAAMYALPAAVATSLVGQRKTKKAKKS